MLLVVGSIGLSVSEQHYSKIMSDCNEILQRDPGWYTEELIKLW